MFQIQTASSILPLQVDQLSLLKSLHENELCCK